ncbi:PPOX class F420-dependent enzyme [Actinocatenispora thailandica]|uniref:PPOX class F420-dependent enzyme n=1 Tax=Actinocatenispora thailandica TaxID=227318 RepID=A0A7R7DQ61_9ACTN|nr:PPOX class F420-dependent oxidoreductase [Actinocatenispora thailandica]BCJ35850.1 PPOX class F420-dependent enzyme [Actinocatenispora thailandica]
MPTGALPERVREMLAKPNPAVITTVRPDGQPVSVATWYRLDGDRILVNMDERRARLRYLREDPRVSLTVIDEDNWYTHVSLQGRVTELVDDPDLSGIDSLSRHYGGNPYPDREHARVNAWITIDRWHGWGSLAE